MKNKSKQYQNGAIDPLRIFTPLEIQTILDDLHRRAKRSLKAWAQLAVFRLSAGMGLRASEIAGVRMEDLVSDDERPYLVVRSGKGDKSRRVPFYDKTTFQDLKLWKDFRAEVEGAEPDSFLIVKYAPGKNNGTGGQHTRRSIRGRFISACKALGPERQSRVTTHDGRHTWVSYVAKEKGLKAAQLGAGHASPRTTYVYWGLVPGSDDGLCDLFAGKDLPPT